MLSLTSEYALRAVLYMAGSEDNGRIRVEPMATALGLPRNYLSKTLNQLAKLGILDSQRGPTGGFRLAVPAESLRLSRIVEAFDPGLTARSCLLGRPFCSDVTPCPAHSGWKEIADDVARFFQNTTIADLLENENSEAELGHAWRGRRASRAARAPTNGHGTTGNGRPAEPVEATSSLSGD